MSLVTSILPITLLKDPILMITQQFFRTEYILHLKLRFKVLQ